MAFMSSRPLAVDGFEVTVARSGYTGEDGFEISLPAGDAEAFARRLLAESEVEPAGLGARDTLRLEAGLCLYGNDIDATTTPIEAGLGWAIGRRRRAALDFPGGAIIAEQIAHGPPRRRVGLRPEGRAPARAGTAIVDGEGEAAGTITSGTVSPTLGTPICIGYVRADLAPDSTSLGLMIRGHRHPALVARMPFVPHRYAR